MSSASAKLVSPPRDEPGGVAKVDRRAPGAVDVDFSLALHNRTGKYFIGRDIIQKNASLVRKVRYWRMSYPAQSSPPLGLTAKIAGRLEFWETRLRSRNFASPLGLLRSPRPVLHLDPLTVLNYRLTGKDIVLCHDVGPSSHPALFAPDVVAAYNAAYRKIASIGPRMVFVSRASQREFHRYFPGDYALSRVVYPGLRVELGNPALTPMAVTTPFLLTVGYVGARKNQLAAIEAFGLSGLCESNVRYVICGGREPGYEAVAAAAANTPGVQLLPYVSDGELNWLYRKAAGFVLPSLLEGFGIPVAEASVAGLIPIVSRGSVLEEVAGNGALAVDPENRDEIARAMRDLIAISPAEASWRRRELSNSIARFSHEQFCDAWRAIMAAAAAPEGITA